MKNELSRQTKYISQEPVVAEEPVRPGTDWCQNGWRFHVTLAINSGDQTIHAYDNSAFNSGHEMQERSVDGKSDIQRLGYQVYAGKQGAR